MTQLKGAFKMMSWEEQPYDVAAGQPKLTHAEVTHELTGGIDGEAEAFRREAFETDARNVSVGVERVRVVEQGAQLGLVGRNAA